MKFESNLDVSFAPISSYVHVWSMQSSTGGASVKSPYSVSLSGLLLASVVKLSRSVLVSTLFGSGLTIGGGTLWGIDRLFRIGGSVCIGGSFLIGGSGEEHCNAACIRHCIMYGCMCGCLMSSAACHCTWNEDIKHQCQLVEIFAIRSKAERVRCLSA